MTQKNSESAERASGLATKSADLAQNGRVVVEKVVTAVQEINENNGAIMNKIEESNHRFGEIVKIINEIGGKTKVINDIVFQTKLLSFNASVEAARAGEHGKGFAVVAEEVGNLAQMSGNAAREISSMLDESTQRVANIIDEMKSQVGHFINLGKEKVEVGARVAKECEGALLEIINVSTEVQGMASSIASASREQSQGISEITRAMNELDTATQQNSAVCQQTSSSSESLASQAEILQEVTVEMSVLILGGSSKELRPFEYSDHPSAAEFKVEEDSFRKVS
jgi:methyl-accepting chemotaxis protein